LAAVLVARTAAGETSAPAAADADAPLLLDGVAAEVGDRTITIAEAMVEARRLADVQDLPPAEAESRLRALYRQALDGLVERQLVLLTHARTGQKLQSWVVDKRVEELIEDRFGGDRSKLSAALARERMTIDDWRKRVEEELVLGAMRQNWVDQRAVVRPEQIRAFYATNAAAFRGTGTVRVAMIVLQPGEGETAEAFAGRVRRVQDDLAAGKDFGETARRQSREPHAARGGDWGFVNPAEEFRPELARALAGLKPGQTSGPIATDAGTYILRKGAERPDGVQTIEDVWDEIDTQLRRRESARLYREWIGRLRQDVRVIVHDLPR
jgi:peptidyl-prolyl cis-trans isomerase SurA